MMGCQKQAGELFYEIHLDSHIPPDHLLRKINDTLDLSFLRQTLAKHYGHTGRPSIDPELMIRILLIGYLFGIRSECRLIDEVHLNLAYRWFCRLGLDGEVPNRSTFSKNRHGRFRDSDIFRKLFEEIVRQCIDNGLVANEGMSIDGSVVDADANRDRRISGMGCPQKWAEPNAVTKPVGDYLAALDEQLPRRRDEPKRQNPKYLSETDPQAAWSRKHGPGRFAYETNYLIDNANGIIVDVEATPARLSQEIVAAKTMLNRAQENLGLKANLLAADGSYGTGPFLSWLLERSIEPHIPVLDRKKQTNGKFTKDEFQFDAATNTYICPDGKTLGYRGATYATRVQTYKSKPADCNECPIKTRCTDGKVRTVTRLLDEPAREKARALASTKRYAESRRNREKVEMLFAHLKRNLNFRRLKLRGLRGATEEFLLAATAQNLRRLIKLVPT